MYDVKKSSSTSWDSGLFLNKGPLPNDSHRAYLRHAIGSNFSMNSRISDATMAKPRARYRYERNFFINMVRDELKSLCTNKNTKRNIDNEVARSVESYRFRKRLPFSLKIKDANNLIGCIVRLLDQFNKEFLVQACDISWVENGIVPKIEHILLQHGENIRSKCRVNVCLLDVPHYIIRENGMMQKCEAYEFNFFSIPKLDLFHSLKQSKELNIVSVRVKNMMHFAS